MTMVPAEMWRPMPTEPGRYLWRLGPASGVYQVCYVIPDENGAFRCIALSAQLWAAQQGTDLEEQWGLPIGVFAKVQFDDVPPNSVGGEWLYLAGRIFQNEGGNEP